MPRALDLYREHKQRQTTNRNALPNFPFDERIHHTSPGLSSILDRYFLPQIERVGGLADPISDAFLGQALQPGALYGAAERAATGTARQLFRPGGEVSSLISGARGRSIGQGFAPEAAEGAERSILRGATDRIGDVFAQQAGQLEGLRFQGLAGAFGDTQQALRDLIESIFTGTASIEQLGLARQAL